MTKRLSVFFFFSAAIYAGQSFVFSVTTQTLQNTNVPAQSGAWMTEMYFDSIPTDLSLSADPWFPVIEASTGIVLELFTNGCGTPTMLCVSANLDGVGIINTRVGSNFPTQAFYLRIQHDVASLGGSHTNTDYVEIWDTNGAEQYKLSVPYVTASSTSNGSRILGTADGQHIAFRRLCSGALLPFGTSKMPTTAGGCPVGTEVYEWKFDGNLNDSSGNGFKLTLSGGGSANYATTLHQNVIAVLKTFGAPFWSNWVSMRAGHPNRLDGTSSLSQSDSTNTVTCFWQMSAGASVPAWDSHTSCTPTLTGLIFGSYTPQLTVTDPTGAQAVATLQIGAVAYDDNGVVINSPAADQMFGPMIAFGKNPWALQDKLALDATKARSNAYNTRPGNPPSWDTALPGTVSYSWVAPTGTTFASSCSSTATSCTVTDATKLDLTSFPTIIYAGSVEYMVVASASGNVLTFAYDGRGYHFGSAGHQAAQTWAIGTRVQQWKVTGSGTSFLSTFNPLGAGWSGQTISPSGTCQVAHNSTAIVGTGTAWNSQANVGFAIRISGHHSGTAFEFFAYVSSVADATHLAINRSYPNDADDESGLTCATFDPGKRFAVLHYGRCGSGSYSGCATGNITYPYDGRTYFTLDGCESDTACYIYGGFDPDAVHPAYSTCNGNSQSECGVHFSYMDGQAFVGDNGGINFYDEGLAHMALYLRSGWQPALDAFRKVEGQENTPNNGYMFYPELTSGDIGGFPRRVSVLGMWAAYLFDGKTSNLSGLRHFANNTIVQTAAFTGAGGAAGGQCDYQDLRESLGYPLQWLAAAALWDPNAASLGYVSALSNWYSAYSPCAVTSGSALEVNSWSSNFYFNSNQTPPLTATAGSPILTGTGIPPAICGTTPSATGTASVTNGSDVVTGSGFVPGGGKIMFEDSVLGLITFNYIYNSSGQIHLSGRYPGASASSVTYRIHTDSNPFNIFDSQLAFGASNSDPQLKKQWDCTWNNSSQITLDRNWDGPNETVYGWSGGSGGIGLAGHGTQPFFLGVNVLSHRMGAQIGGSTGANFTTLGTNAATWLKAYGYDPVSGGTHYGRIFAGCEPIFADSTQPQNFPEGARNPGCSFNGSSVAPNFSKQISRVDSVEIGNTASVSFGNDPSGANKSFWDTFYANIWDVAPYTAAGFGSDGLGSANCGPSNDFSQGKWTGFCFGIGMSHQWPAARLGGVTPAIPRTIDVTCNISSVANATKCRVTLTKPDGSTVTNTCTTSPCPVIGDARQGDHLLKVDYLNASDAVLSPGIAALVPVL